MTQKKFLTPKELSDRWGSRISPRTLANWRCAGTSPPYVKVNGAVLYPLQKLEDWEAGHTVTGTYQYSSMHS